METPDPTSGNRIPTSLSDEMQQSYMAYAMSVIIGRALPDIRDGLKPANRRVLYGMQQMGLQPGRPYKKSAKIVGEVMGNYHPHGGEAIYDTLVRMAQDFNLRAILVDGQGNFGSVDGDPPAAMRYTEARLTRLGSIMMSDIDKDTVDYAPTYDDSSTEPTVLPTAFPNLLVNGAAGIAVGMATNIPPHNLGEVVDALQFVLGSEDLTPEERLDGVTERILGPDFPTAGLILGRGGIRQAYRTGRGSVVMRARAEIETRKGDRESIVVTEIPYQVNKATLIKKIAELHHEKRVEGITDIRDESDRRGMRIVVDVKKGESAQVLLNNLYKHTQLQDTFGIIMLAIVEQRPRVLNILEVCELFLDFRREVVRRRTAFELRKAEARAHILEGYAIALDHLDAVIALIRAARTPDDARGGLMASFGLTEIQARAILDLQLQRLTGLERQKILEELKEIRVLIADLRDILAHPQRIDAIIVAELTAIRDDHGNPRRTQIIEAVDEITYLDTIVDEDVAISITHTGYIKRTSIASYRSQRRGGRGRMGMKTKDEDFVDQLFIASTHSYILIFTDRGRVYWLKVHEIPDVGPQGKGKAVVNLVHLAPHEKPAAFVAAKEFVAGRYVLLATRKGIIKKTELNAFANVRAGGIIALGVEDDDALIEAVLTGGTDEVLLATREGMAIHFQEDDVRPMGRTAYGVKGIALPAEDAVVALEVVSAGGTVLTVCANGYGKRTPLDEYRLQTRGGKGIINIKTAGRNGPVVGVKFLGADGGVMLITEKGMIIRLNTADISEIGRNTQGVRLIHLEEGDHLVSVARLAERDDVEDSLPAPPPDGPPEPAKEEECSRVAALPLFLALSTLGCQSHPEKGVVDQYFNAVNSGDSQTLASFAAVSFDKKVDHWEITQTLEEKKSDAPLPALAQKVKEVEAELAANTKAARAYNNEHYVELDQLKALKKDAPVPAKLQPIKAEWDKFSEKDRELKKASANAKADVEKEKRNVARSIGAADDIESLGGEMKEKQLELDLTIGGQVQPYVMTVRKYEMKRESGPRVVSRWVVQDLQPRS